MSLTFVALALLAPQGGKQAQEILTQRADRLTRVTADPGQVAARCWQYRLYPPNTPALGERYWGIVEEPSYSRLKQTLVRQRNQQTAWWTWMGQPGRPEPMPYTTFNALGPIALLGDDAWTSIWGALGPSAGREIAARKRRLDAAREVEDALYNTLAEVNWVPSFEANPFRNEGVAVYQVAPIVNAVITLRGFETDLRSDKPISMAAANADLDTFSSIAQRLNDIATQLSGMKTPTSQVVPSMTTEDALSLLNGRFASYTVQAGEGGSTSETGEMSFSFTDTGFTLVKAPTGWYGGTEPVSFASLDASTVRYDPQFGGPQRGGVVFLPKDDLRNSYRGPNGLILPLGTTPREAESLAQAFRRLTRIANGLPVAEPPKSDGDQTIDPATVALVQRFRALGEKLGTLGAMKIGDDEWMANPPAPLATAVARRNELWRDSELGAVLAKQCAPQAKFVMDGKDVTLPMLTVKLGVPMSLTPTEPPKWSIVRVNRSGADAKIVVRQASRATKGKGGPSYTVFRLVEEIWTNVERSPRLSSMRLVVAGETLTPARTTIDKLSQQLFERGGRLMEQNRLPEAERLLRRSLVLRPGWASAWNWLGVSIVRQGRIDDAAPFCNQAVQLNPKYVLALTNLADIRRVQGQISDSKDLAARAVALAPKDAWAHIVLGHACFTNGEFDEAETHYREALKIEPGNGSTHADLAGALLRQNKREDATAEASRALELGWRTHWVYKELAIPKS